MGHTFIFTFTLLFNFAAQAEENLPKESLARGLFSKHSQTEWVLELKQRFIEACASQLNLQMWKSLTSIIWAPMCLVFFKPYLSLIS